ncbi:MAG: aromatic ring-hydroxylating dioxygenase subunit alpha, partial [Pseudomonadota bacterium]
MTNYTSMIKSVKDYVKLPFVYNHWYVAGTTEEFTTTPSSKILLNRSLVFYRTPAGEVVAMQDRCLHRSFPLSEGYLEDDKLVCRYHGIRYNPDGSIARIPCQKSTSTKKLHRYPTVERGPFVFIWMGDPDQPDMEKLPDMPYLDDPAYRTVHGFMPLEGNYLLLQENLNDLTHFAYLHKDTFPFDDAFFDLEEHLEITPNGAPFLNRIEKNPPPQKLALPPEVLGEIEGKLVERWDGGAALGPGVFQGYAPVFVGAEDDPSRRVLKQYVCHYMTPETEKTSHYFWSMSNDYAIENDMFYSMLTQHLGAGFDEDKWAVQLMQDRLDNDHIEFDEMIIAG